MQGGRSAIGNTDPGNWAKRRRGVETTGASDGMQLRPWACAFLACYNRLDLKSDF